MVNPVMQRGEGMLHWKIIVKEDLHLLQVETSGTLNAAGLKTLHYEAIALIRWYGLRRLQIDFQSIDGTTLTPEQILDIPRQYDYLELPKDCKIAIIFPAPFRKFPGLYESFVAQYAYQVFLTEDVKEAWTWLFTK